MKTWNVELAWTPRNPTLDREHKSAQVEADSPAQAIYVAFKQVYEHELTFGECDYTKEEFEEQLEDHDGVIVGAYLAELPVGYRGQFTFLVRER